VPGRRSPVPARGTPVKAGRPSPAPEAFGVRVSQGHPVSRPVRVRVHRAALRVEGAVEEHAFDPLVVVEVLDVPQVRYPGRHVCACRFGAQWSETWRQSTAPALINATESASVQLYSPAATSGWIWRRIAASPLRFLDDTGSSNQVTSRAESPGRDADSLPGGVPPLASMYSSATARGEVGFLPENVVEPATPTDHQSVSIPWNYSSGAGLCGLITACRRPGPADGQRIRLQGPRRASGDSQAGQQAAPDNLPWLPCLRRVVRCCGFWLRGG
jgi:hypothetical protein